MDCSQPPGRRWRKLTMNRCATFNCGRGTVQVSPGLEIPSLVIPTTAIRDEGTSYHYLPAAESVDGDAGLTLALQAELGGLGLPVVTGPVWTTDAPYRETVEQLERHARDGILAVEMQAASLFAFGAVRRAWRDWLGVDQRERSHRDLHEPASCKGAGNACRGRGCEGRGRSGEGARGVIAHGAQYLQVPKRRCAGRTAGRHSRWRSPADSARGECRRPDASDELNVCSNSSPFCLPPRRCC